MNNEKVTPMGDAHFGKRVELVDDGTTKYLFKPRSACAEKALEAFLFSLKQEGFPYLPASEHVLKEEAGAFRSAFVAHLPAASSEDVCDYFHRCGALIFLAYLLGSTDLHFENIIACRNKPVVIDAETILGAPLQRSSGTLHTLTNSVLHAGLLPHIWYTESKTPLRAGLIGEDNTENILYYQNKPCMIYDYEHEVTEGFLAAYRFTLEHKTRIGTLLACFSDSTARVLLRPSEVYGGIIGFLEKTEADKKEPFARALLERAYQKDMRADFAAAMEPVLQAEIDAVCAGDVPYFSAHYRSRALWCKEAKLARAYFEHTPEESIHERLNALTREDMHAQSRLIALSLAAARPLAKRRAQSMKATNAERAMFEKLESGYISSLSAGFVSLTSPVGGKAYLQSVGFGLYHGLSGILCAYAALYQSTKDNDILQALRARYAPLGASIRAGYTLTDDISLAEGTAGVIAALLHIGELTGDKHFCEDALCLAEKIEINFPANAPLDLLYGISGLAVVLPKLPQKTAKPLAEAILPLLENAQSDLTGAAHGAAGIALGIAAAAFILDTDRYDNKIIELLHAENRAYMEEERNWRDMRVKEEARFMHGWCTGAPGIGMCRKKMLSYTDNPAIIAICKQDIERATNNLCAHLTAKKDCLCCGNAARWMALSNLDIKKDGFHTALYDTMKGDGLTLLHPLNTADVNYSLMQGLAGVIYAIILYGDTRSGGMLC